MSFPLENSTAKTRRWLRWPDEARTIAQKSKHPEALCEELAVLTGFDKRACWRFLNKHGVKRPGSKSRRKFDPGTANILIDYISDHGVSAAAQKFGYDSKSLYNFLYRQEHTKLSRDSFSLRQVCAHLRVRYRRARSWIDQGLLEAERQQTRTGGVRYLIDFEALRRFCKLHRNQLITRRSAPGRIDFLTEYVFASKHAELLRTRESKREAEAFERGEYLNRAECA
jgi:hypothetical protein